MKINKLMQMPKKMPISKLNKEQQLIYDIAYSNGIEQGKADKIKEIKKLLEINI